MPASSYSQTVLLFKDEGFNHICAGSITFNLFNSPLNGLKNQQGDSGYNQTIDILLTCINNAGSCEIILSLKVTLLKKLNFLSPMCYLALNFWFVFVSSQNEQHMKIKL